MVGDQTREQSDGQSVEDRMRFFQMLGAGIVALSSVAVYVFVMMYVTHLAGASGSPLMAVAGPTPGLPTLAVGVVAVVIGGVLIYRVFIPLW